MSRKTTTLTATEGDIRQLRNLADMPNPVVARAASALLVLINDPDVNHAVEVTGMGKTELYKWRKIYIEEGISGILSMNVGRPRSKLDHQISTYVSTLPPEAERDADEIAKLYGVSKNTLYDILERHDLSLTLTTVWRHPTSEILRHGGPYFAGCYLGVSQQIVIMADAPLEMLGSIAHGYTKSYDSSLNAVYDRIEKDVSLADALQIAAVHPKHISNRKYMRVDDFLSKTIGGWRDVQLPFHLHLFTNNLHTSGYRDTMLLHTTFHQFTDVEMWRANLQAFVGRESDSVLSAMDNFIAAMPIGELGVEPFIWSMQPFETRKLRHLQPTSAI